MLAHARRRMERAIAGVRPKMLRPSSIHLCATWRCNLHCSQCDIPLTGKRERPELTTGQVTAAIRQLREWLGPFHLNIAGGEPFVRKDMMDIIEFCTGNGVSVGVTTNGMLITEDIARRIEKAGIQSLNISLDGLTPGTHDRMRNSKGAHKQVMKVIERLNRPRDYCLVLATILHAGNAGEVLELVDWTENKMLNGIIFQPLFSTFGRPYEPGWWTRSGFWPNTPDQLAQMDRTIDSLIRGRREGSPVVNTVEQLEAMRTHFHHPGVTGPRSCSVDTKNFAINEYGDALLCFWLPPVGSILNTHPRDIWRSALARERRRQIRGCRMSCSVLNCHFD